MNIVCLQAATGEEIDGPKVRVPPGNYDIQKSGNFSSCYMSLDGSEFIEINSVLILSNHSTVKMKAFQAENLTVRFVKKN